MTGNLYVLLALAEASMSFLPTVGAAAAHRSRSSLRRTSSCGVALMGRLTVSVPGTRTARRRTRAAGPNAAPPGEALAP